MALGLNIGSKFLDVVKRYADIATADISDKQENNLYCKPVQYDVYSIALSQFRKLSSSHYWLKDMISQDTLCQQCGRSR